MSFLPPDRCYIIAEAGVNHNGNAEMARELLRYHPALPWTSREYARTRAKYRARLGDRSVPATVGIEIRETSSRPCAPLLDAEATIPPHAEGLEPSDAVLERLP